MRSFQLLFWIGFILFYALFTLGALHSILQIIDSRKNKKFRFSFLLIAFIICISLILLYVWPGDIRNSNKYALYFVFNGILIIDLIFKIPLSLLFVISILFSSRNNRKIISWIGAILSCTLSIILLYGMLFGKNDLTIKHVELEFSNLPNAFDGFQIIQISDLHLGSFIYSNRVLKNVQKQIKAINPELILFTGDLVNNFSYELNGWDAIFQKINKKGKSYSILGNHDYGNYSNWENDKAKAKNFQSITDAHIKFGFQLLRNESTAIVTGTDTIYLIGVENWGHPPFPQYANLEQALSGVPRNAFKILLTHDPAYWESQINGKENIELTLSGHTHGLQWAIKPAGIPLSLSYLVRKNWGGLYKSNNSYLYVNLGLGTVGIPCRIDMPAELTVLTLKVP